jgi:hypothetical protein
VNAQCIHVQFYEIHSPSQKKKKRCCPHVSLVVVLVGPCTCSMFVCGSLLMRHWCVLRKSFEEAYCTGDCRQPESHPPSSAASVGQAEGIKGFTW